MEVERAGAIRAGNIYRAEKQTQATTNCVIVAGTRRQNSNVISPNPSALPSISLARIIMTARLTLARKKAMNTSAYGCRLPLGQ